MTLHNGSRKCLIVIFILLLLSALLQGCESKRDRSKELISLGQGEFSEGEREDALKDFGQAAAADPSYDVYLEIGSFLAYNGMPKEGISYLEKATKLHSTSDAAGSMERSQVYRLIGDVYSKLGEIPDAEKAYSTAVSIYEDNAVAYNDWGYMYADLGIKLDEALRLTKRAVNLCPKEGAYLDSLGWVYYRKHDFRSAIRYLKQAVEIEPSQGEIRYHLGTCYEAAGFRKSAIVEYSKAVYLDKSCDAARRRLVALRSSSFR